MDTRRLILAIIFFASSLMLWENWQKYNQPQPAPSAAAPAATGSSADVPKPSTTLAAAPGSSAPVATPVAGPAAAPAGESFIVATDLVKATFSTQGGDLVGLELLKYRAHGNKDKNFVLFDPQHQ